MSSQIRYMMPIRRASACLLPSASVAKIRRRKSRTEARSCAECTSAAQSKARPSLCSETPPSRQEREIPIEPVPGYWFCSHRDSFRAPGFACGLQVVCGW